MRTLQERAVTQSVPVYVCDRCSKEIPSEHITYQGYRPTSGSHLTAVQFGEGNTLANGGSWLPFKPIETDPAKVNIRADYDAANVDLCANCTAALIEWFRNAPRDPGLPSS